jgi:GntR family transcriptional regulator
MANGRTAPTRSSSAPLYVQIVERLGEQIAKGAYLPGSPLPSESSLTKQFGVSRVTVRQALAELESRGLIFRQQGRGTFVAEPHVRQQMSRQAQTIVEALRREGIEPEIQIASLDHISPDPHVAAVLGTGDQEIATLTRLYLHNGVPIAQSILHLPMSMSGVARILAQKQGADQTTYSIFESMGLAIKEAKHVISTVALDPATAQRLRMKVGDVCLATDRITFGTNGSVLEFTKFVYPPGRMSFEITLPRSSSAKVVRIYSNDSGDQLTSSENLRSRSARTAHRTR